MADIKVRKVDAGAVAKIDELAKKKKMSRESYLRCYIESLSVLGELKELDEKYSNLVKSMADIIQANTDEMTKLRIAYENKLDKS